MNGFKIAIQNPNGVRQNHFYSGWTHDHSSIFSNLVAMMSQRDRMAKYQEICLCCDESTHLFSNLIRIRQVDLQNKARAITQMAEWDMHVFQCYFLLGEKKVKGKFYVVASKMIIFQKSLFLLESRASLGRLTYEPSTKP
jgi:hypothetical protein